MKKVFLFTFVLSFFCFYSFAQVEKGMKIRGISTSLKLDISEYGAAFNGMLDFQAGRFLSDKFALGSELGLTTTISDYGESFSGTLGAFSRYYFSNQSKTLPYFETGLALGAQVGDYDIEGFLVRAKVGPGISFRIGENIILDTQLKYVLSAFPDPGYGTSTTNSIYYTMGVGMLLPAKK